MSNIQVHAFTTSLKLMGHVCFECQIPGALERPQIAQRHILTTLAYLKHLMDIKNNCICAK